MINIHCNFKSADIALRWRLISEQYGKEIEYTQDRINIVEVTISQLINNGNQKTTHESNCIMESMSEINDTGELPKVIFSVNLKNIPISMETSHPVG